MDDDSDDDDEVEKELKKYPGYHGKFNSLKNRLNAVSNQLNSLESKGVTSEELQQRYDHIEDLTYQINFILSSFEDIETKIKEKVKKDKKAKKIERKDAVEQNKSWYIKFSKELDPKTLSDLDIVVFDENDNLIETVILYASQVVTVTPMQSYESGKTYTLYIGKDIKSEQGYKLSNSVKMQFNVK